MLEFEVACLQMVNGEKKFLLSTIKEDLGMESLPRDLHMYQRIYTYSGATNQRKDIVRYKCLIAYKYVCLCVYRSKLTISQGMLCITGPKDYSQNIIFNIKLQSIKNSCFKHRLRKKIRFGIPGRQLSEIKRISNDHLRRRYKRAQNGEHGEMRNAPRTDGGETDNVKFNIIQNSVIIH